jgi:dynein heavy chain
MVVEGSLDPLEEYLRCYDSYRDILKIKPDEYIKKVETEEKPREIEAIRDEVNNFLEKEHKLKESMPESVQVGFFKVNCKEIANLLAGKYQMLSKGLIDVIAKRAKNTTLKLYDDL